jgi:MFS family permease
MRLIYGPNNHAEERLEYEIHAIRLEEANESINKGNYISCFRGYHLKRTATVAFLYSTHNTGGAAFLAQNIYFLIIAGLEAIHAFDIGIGGFALAIIIVLASGAYLQRISRRNVVLAGLVINFLIMVVIGGLYWATSNGGLWAIAVLMNILISLQTSMLLGAGWPIAAELSSYHLRAKTLSIGVVSQTLTSWLFNFITPYMYNVDSGNLGAKTGFIYAGTSLLLIVGGWYLIPDTTGMTTEEIDGAYEAGVSPRAFQSFRTHVPNAVDKEMG